MNLTVLFYSHHIIPAPMRKRPVILGCLLFLGAIVIMALLITTGTRPKSGRVDPSTPLTQDGFTLLDVAPVQATGQCDYELPVEENILQRLINRIRGRSSPRNVLATAFADSETGGGLGLWVKLDWLPPGSSRGMLVVRGDKNDYTAVATASTGETTPLRCNLQWGMTADTYLFVSLPPGYPDEYRWMDVTVSDTAGHKARWRIRELPRSVHAIPPPVTVQESVKVASWTIRARAYREMPYPVSTSGGSQSRLWYDVKTTGAEQAEGWELVTTNATPEWLPSGPRAGGGTSTTSPSNGGSFGSSLFAPYPKSQRYVRIPGEVRHFDFVDEKVTFPNLTVKPGSLRDYFVVLNKPMTVTTPSGIRITLPAQNNAQGQPPTQSHMADAITLVASYPLQVDRKSAPKSLLTRRYTNPAGVQVRGLASPFDKEGSSSTVTPNGLTLSVGLGGLKPTSPLSLTLIIRHRVELKKLPFTLTIPVHDKKPKTPDWP